PPPGWRRVPRACSRTPRPRRGRQRARSTACWRRRRRISTGPGRESAATWDSLLSLGADAPEVLVAADEQLAGRRHDRRPHGLAAQRVTGEQLVLRARREHERAALARRHVEPPGRVDHRAPGAAGRALLDLPDFLAGLQLITGGFARVVEDVDVF